MVWKPIVAGVDESAEASAAAVFACGLADRAQTECALVHVVPDPWAELAVKEKAQGFEEMEKDLLEGQWERVTRGLLPAVSGRAVAKMTVRLGHTGPALLAEAAARDAELVVLGGKRHSMVGRWFGSTAHYLVRHSPVPTLITDALTRDVRRVLIAVDRSHAAGPTIEWGERIVSLYGAHEMALHAIEPPPSLATFDGALLAPDADEAEARLQEQIWPLLRNTRAGVQVRHGRASQTIAAVAAEWKADLIVVGSHGRGWVDRLLLGSTTESLLNRLPASLLVIPIHSATGGATFETATAAGEAQ